MKVSKIISLMLAVVMLLSCASMALADEGNPQPVLYTITVNTSVGGSAYATMAAASTNTLVSASAFPEAGYEFVGWTATGVQIVDPTSPTIVFNVDQSNITLTAVFTPAYKIIVQSLGGGMVSTTPSPTAHPGETVNIIASAFDGYMFYSWSSPSGITFINPGSYLTSFTMPAHDVIITPTFYAIQQPSTPQVPVAPSPSVPSSPAPSAPISPAPAPESNDPFNDVSSSDWFYKDVSFVYENSLMNGVSTKTFAPKNNTTRGMIVAILHRLVNSPAASVKAGFTDVSDSAYYADAISWASENKIVDGVGNGLFKPDAFITREQLATILYRFAKYRNLDVSVGEDTNILSYCDATSINEYAVSAIQWAVGSGLVQGSDCNDCGSLAIMPSGLATRAQVAAILNRFCSAYPEA